MAVKTMGIVAGLMAMAMGVSAVTTSYDPLKTSDFCRRHGHATAHIKNKVYIDGGAINVRLGDPKNYTVEHLLYLDLDNDEARIPALSGPLSKPPAVPSLYGGQLWADEVNERLFAFGGDFADDMTPDDNPAVWAYDPWNNTWASIPIEPSANVTRRSFGASTTIQDEGKAYYLGGWYGDRNIAGFQGSRQAAGDLLIFDMVQRVWRKDSGPQGAPRVEGVLVYVPAGDTGLLVSFGGLYVNGNGTTPAPMEDIDVYDASTGDWFRVKAAGTVPEPRRRFCAGESSAGDGSSHNIYLYGGAATNNSIGYGDVYILTMPSFRWIKWWPTTDESLRPHNTLSCNVVKGNQMIVMGGHFPGDDKCDSPEAFGVHNMDLSNQNTEKAVWYGYTKVNTAYKVPEAIVNVVGGSETGNATLRAPEGGFNNTLLQTLFSRTLSPIPGRAPTRTPKSKKLPKSALIGMVLGILVALILVLVGILLILKRVKNKRKVEQSARDADQQGLPLVAQTSFPRVAEVHGSPTQNVPPSAYMYDKSGNNASVLQELASTDVYKSYPTDPVELDSGVYGGGRASSSKPYTQVSGTTPKNMIEEEPYSDPQRIPLLQQQQINDGVTPTETYNGDGISPATDRRTSGATFDQTRASRHSHFSEGPWSPARDAVEEGRLAVERR